MVAPLVGVIGARLGATAAVRLGASSGGIGEVLGATAGRHTAISLAQNAQDRISAPKDAPEQQ